MSPREAALLEKVEALEAENAQLREDVYRLKLAVITNLETIWEGRDHTMEHHLKRLREVVETRGPT